jgi:hypothetical protein
MSKIKSTNPYLVRQVNSTNDRENGSEEVLKICATTVKFSLEEHQAVFDAAVFTYRARNLDVSEKAARRLHDL